MEEQVLLAVVRTGRAPDGSGAYGMAVRRELEEVAGRDRLWRGVDLAPLLAGGSR
jgi:hypothetical protein